MDQNNTSPQDQVNAANAAVQNMIDSLGIDMLPPEEQEAFLDDLSKAAVEAALIRGRLALPEGERDVLDKLFADAADDPENEAKAEALAAFFEKDMPNFDVLFRTELEQLMAEYQAMREEAESE